MRCRLYIIGLLLAVFLSFNCFAAPNFSTNFLAVTTEQTYDTCACRNIEYDVTVVNTGDFVATYNIKQSGFLAKFALVGPSMFVLQPGEIIDVHVVARIPCNIKGTFPLKTIISNDLNVKKSFIQTFKVRDCEAIQTNLTFYTEDGCRCSVFEYNIDVTNPGVFEEEYTFSDLNATFSENPMILAGGETKQLVVKFAPPCAWGSRAIKLNIETKYTEQDSKLILPLEVKEDCAAEEYEEPYNYMLWIIIGLGVLIIFVIFLLIIILVKKKKPRGHNKPNLVRLHLDAEVQKKKFPWRKLIVILVLLAIITGAAYAAYIFIPPLFTGRPMQTPPPKPAGGGMFGEIVPSEQSEVRSPKSEEETPDSETPDQTTTSVVDDPDFNGTLISSPIKYSGFCPWKYWIYYVVALAVFITAIIIFHNANGYRKHPAVLWAKRISVIILILLILLGIACGIFYAIEHWGVMIWAFIVAYYIYFIVGVVLLVGIISLFVYSNRKDAYNSKTTCSICGRTYKTEAGLEKHMQSKH